MTLGSARSSKNSTWSAHSISSRILLRPSHRGFCADKRQSALKRLEAERRRQSSRRRSGIKRRERQGIRGRAGRSAIVGGHEPQLQGPTATSKARPVVLVVVFAMQPIHGAPLTTKKRARLRAISEGPPSRSVDRIKKIDMTARRRLGPRTAPGTRNTRTFPR